MKSARLKWTVAVVVLAGAGAGGARLLRGQGMGGTPSGDPATELRAVRKDLSAMERSRAAVQAMLARAKKEKDIIKINCVQRKLDQVKNLIALAREQFSKYLMDKASGATGSSVSLRQRVSMFRERVTEREQEARQCAGEGVRVTERPEVTETVDPRIPQEDTTQPTGSIWVMPRPPQASPFE